MGYLKEQTDWDNYWGYLTERQALIQDGTLFDATGADAAGRKARQDVIQQGGGLRAMGGAKGAATAGQTVRYEGYSGYYKSFLEQEGQLALMAKYGISPIIQNKDGDVFGWNGSSYTKVVKVDDHNYGAIVGQLIKSTVISLITGGVFSELAGFMSGMPGIVGKMATHIKDFLDMKMPTGVPGVGEQNPLVIMNFVDEAINTYNDITSVTDNDNDQGGYIENKDGTYTIVNANNLPPGYIINPINGNIIHEATNTVVYDGDARKELYPVYGYGANGIRFEPYKEGDKNGGGNTGSTDGSTSGGAPMSQAEANAAIQELLESGLVGQDFFDAAYEAGITIDQLGEAMNEGVLPRGTILNPSDADAGGTEGRPNLVLYDGNPNLLDENGVWVGGGTFFDRTDPENPRKYYVWTNKETGESVKVYDDELDTYDGGVKDFEAYLKDELPDITDDELILARRLIELGDPVGQVIADIIAGRKDLNNGDTQTVTLPNGETAEVPVDDTRKEGDPCSIGDKYNGTVVVAPSGQLVCKIDFGDSDETVDNDGDPDATPDATPKEGDPCPLPGGAGEGVIKDGECQPRTGVTNAAIVPSLICESGWSDSAGACIPVDDPRISGVNAPNPGQCPVGYSKNRRGECIPNTQGDMGGESEGDNNNGSTPNDGDPCEVDGKQGKYQDGVCVISTNPVNPGVIDLTGASDWGDGGTGGGTGGGNGPGDGPGNGPGNGGNGPGLGDVGARKGSSNPTWSPIPPGYKFRRFQKRQGIGANVPMLNQSLFKGPDLSPMRQGLLTSMQNDLKRPKS
jgi:hypothetical protein